MLGITFLVYGRASQGSAIALQVLHNLDWISILIMVTRSLIMVTRRVVVLRKPGQWRNQVILQVNLR